MCALPVVAWHQHEGEVYRTIHFALTKDMTEWLEYVLAVEH